jgi:hypothetical protein
VSPYTVLCFKTHSSCSHPSLQILPDSIACRLYVITVLVETTIDLVIEGDLLLRFHKADKACHRNQATSPRRKCLFSFLSSLWLSTSVPRCSSLFSVNTISPASSSWLWHWTPCTLGTPCSFSRSREFGPLLCKKNAFPRHLPSFLGSSMPCSSYMQSYSPPKFSTL